MERLSTGKRINSAADDAAGVAITSRLTSNLKGINQSIRNAMDAQALIDTAEGGLQETEALLQRIRELAVQAASDTNSSADRAALDAEKTQLMAEIDRIASSTTWAGQNLLDGTFSNKNFQVGGGTMAMDSLSSSIQSTTVRGLNLTSIIGSGYSGPNSHPGANNSNDVSVIWDTAIGSVFIRFMEDTTGGLSSSVEVQGVEYIISAGTVGAKAAALTSQLSSAGHNVANYSNVAGYADGSVGMGGEVINDYANFYLNYNEQYTLDSLYTFGDPLNGLDGTNQDTIAGIAFNGIQTLDLRQSDWAKNAITLTDTALQTLNSQRASLGALSNRIDHIVANNTNTATNIAKSISRIEDADFAAETTNLAKQQILQQAATAMLAQANASKQNILTLLNL